jgi:DNA-binding NarL/FixJ family response regulator
MLLRSNVALAAGAALGAAAGLSEQQQRVLSCALSGFEVKETAAQLGVTAETVRTQWTRIMRKTDLVCPAAVLAAARTAAGEWLDPSVAPPSPASWAG